VPAVSTKAQAGALVTGSGEWQSDRSGGLPGSGDRQPDSGAVPSGDAGADPLGDPDDELFRSGDPTAAGGACEAGQVADPLSKQARLTIWVRGRVQGVGFRWWVRSVALELGLSGLAENMVDGRVKIIAEGNRDGCLALLERLGGPGTPGQVVQVTHRWDQARGGLAGFTER